MTKCLLKKDFFE